MIWTFITTPQALSTNSVVIQVDDTERFNSCDHHFRERCFAECLCYIVFLSFFIYLPSNRYKSVN